MRMQFLVTACVTTLTVLTSYAQAQQSSFENVDGNSDGKVTISEFTAYAHSKLPGFDQLDAFAKKVDADGNGEISQAEFDGRLDVLQQLQSATGDDAMEQNQESEAPGKTESKNDPAIAAYKELKQLILASDWKKAAGQMTRKAQDEFCVEQVLSAKGMLQSEMPMELPGFNDLLDDLEDAFIKHDLNNIGIDASHMFEMHWNMDSDDDDQPSDKKQSDSDRDKEKSANGKQKKEMETTDQKQTTNRQKILTAIDKNGKRWEIIGDLWKAKLSSPFVMSDLTGEVEQAEINGQQAVLKIKTVPPPRDNQPGVVIQVVAPPSFIKMEQVDGVWKYAGRDQKRTEKAVKEFMDNQQQSFGRGGNRTDF